MVTISNGIASLGHWFGSLLGGGEGWFDRDDDDRMTANRAMRYPPVWHCVSKISGAFMVMPLNIYRQSGRKITKQTNHSSYQLLRWRPNEYQTPSQWKRQMIVHALLWGNGRSYIRRVGGKPVELIPLLPDRTTSVMLAGKKWHITSIEPDDRMAQLWQLGVDANGVPIMLDDTGQKMATIAISDEEVFHLPGVGFDGINGLSLISAARQSWGIGLNSEKHIAKQQKKGYSGGLMLEAPANVFRNEADAQEFLEQFRRAHAGVESEQSIGMLREGIKANVMQMSNTDAQFIEQRRFQREDSALLFCLEGILGDNSNASYASLEQRNLAYRLNCLAPWTTAIEEECDIKFLNESERNRDFYHKFNDGALLRTEKSATMSFISQGISSRVLSPNEGREMLELNPYEGGDEYSNPAIDKVDNGSGGASNQPNEPQPASVARLAHLFEVEANKIKDAAKQGSEKGKNFLQWVDEFYEKKWIPKIADCMEEIGLDRDLGSKHCEESRRRILEVCDYSTPDNLVENISKCVSTWKTRANTIGDNNNV